MRRRVAVLALTLALLWGFVAFANPFAESNAAAHTNWPGASHVEQEPVATFQSFDWDMAPMLNCSVATCDVYLAPEAINDLLAYYIWMGPGYAAGQVCSRFGNNAVGSYCDALFAFGASYIEGQLWDAHNLGVAIVFFISNTPNPAYEGDW